MNLNRPVSLIVLSTSLVGAFLAGTWYDRGTAAANGPAAGRRILYYVDPMHPAYTSARPGNAPDCGMQLEPMYSDGQTSGISGSGDPASRQPGAVQMTANNQQFGGVRTTPVEKASSTHTLRLLGRVTPDEGRIYKLNAGIDGYIQDVSPATTGSRVRKNQLLARFSAPGAIMSIQTYVLNIGAEDRFRKSAAEGSPEGQALPAALANIQQRIQQLQNLGMSSVQMDEIRRTREIPTHIDILAPADGLVLSRNVSPGQKFERGAEWYRIADLSRVWIVADVFQQDARYIRPGQRARAVLGPDGGAFSARVSEALTQFDPNTRTLKVRFEAENPEYVLRPDMFADLELPIDLGPAVVVPSDAVIDSGRRRTVFVEVSHGDFEPRAVETGWRFGNQVEITSGLVPGERVVTAGNFLLDSESRMKLGRESGAGKEQAHDPACGMNVDPGAAPYHSEYSGHSYDFCSVRCKTTFDRDPGRYLQKVDGSNQRAAGGSTP